MKILQLDVDKITYMPVKKEAKIFDDVGKEEVSITETLVILTSIEKGALNTSTPSIVMLCMYFRRLYASSGLARLLLRWAYGYMTSLFRWSFSKKFLVSAIALSAISTVSPFSIEVSITRVSVIDTSSFPPLRSYSYLLNLPIPSQLASP